MAVALAYIVGYDNVHAYRYAYEKIDEQANHRSGAAYCGKRMPAGETANDRNVDRVERLLENTAGYQRQCEQQHPRQQRPAEHIDFFAGTFHCNTTKIRISRE